MVGIEDLDFVEPLEKNTAVSAVLVLAVRRVGRGPLDVELAISVALFRPNVAGAGRDFEIPVVHFPLRLAALDGLPVREVLAVEQDDRIRRRAPCVVFGARLSRRDHRRHRPRVVVDLPL